MKRFSIFFFILLALAACGKKPDFVDAPSGEDDFPHTYPRHTLPK